MGLFDRIKIDNRFKTKLSKSDESTIDVVNKSNKRDFEYQTKDLQCWMQDYSIDSKGKLWIYTDDHDKRKRKRDYVTGDVTMYTIITNDDLDYDLDITHEVTAVKGVCKCTKSYLEKRCNKTRLTNERLFEENRRRYDALRRTMRFKLYMFLYKRPVRFTLQIICKVCGIIQRLCNRLQIKLLPW
jgi:hypothetical protein